MERSVYTIGHSNHAIDTFLDLLQRHSMEAVADVRSTPYSRRNPQYNRENLQRSLQEAGVDYVFLGRELGARSEDPACYEDGKVRYDRLAQTERFQAGLRRVEEGAETRRIALMCAEKEPLHCHRTILVARHLEDRGFTILHILADGALETHRQTLDRLVDTLALGKEDLFMDREELHELAYQRQEQKIAHGKK